MSRRCGAPKRSLIEGVDLRSSDRPEGALLRYVESREEKRKYDSYDIPPRYRAPNHPNPSTPENGERSMMEHKHMQLFLCPHTASKNTPPSKLSSKVSGQNVQSDAKLKILE
ncbi:hypothetical protein AAG570_012366 [Ranatra chinensis]|uniref:Uncharacterized protein n=1 Tax=Ranatra chinensis TaxID=642074 RepID=A0ABD0Z6Y9_9HEMI